MTAIEDDVRVQVEVPAAKRAVFDAVVEGQTHQVDFLDRSLLGMPACRELGDKKSLGTGDHVS